MDLQTVEPKNRGGRPPSSVSMQRLARTHARQAMAVLIEICSDNTAPAGARVEASQSILALAFDGAKPRKKTNESRANTESQISNQ